MNGRRQTAGLPAEHEDYVTWCAEGGVPEESSALGGKEVRRTEAWELPLELVPALPHVKVYVFPVVESRAFQLALAEGEAERLDEMQCGAGGETRPAGVAGVPVDLGMHEHDMERHAMNLRFAAAARDRVASGKLRQSPPCTSGAARRHSRSSILVRASGDYQPRSLR